jgi:hypothetical protein
MVTSESTAESQCILPQPGTTMTKQQTAHIEPSKHSTEEVDEFLRHVESHVDVSKGAGSPAIKPNTDLDKDGKPSNETPKNPAS